MGRGLSLDKTADYTESVVEGTFRFFENKHVCTTTKYTDCLALILHSRDFNHPLPGTLNFIHQLCISQFILRKRVNVRNWFATCALQQNVSISALGLLLGVCGGDLADEFDFVAFDVFDGEDFEF
jgi:hypothetical protein